MRRCSFSSVAYYRPTTACPEHQSHSRSVLACQPVQLLFFICGRWDPATDIEKEGEKKRENLLRPTLDGVHMAQLVRRMYTCTSTLNTCAQEHTNCVHCTGQCAVSRYIGRPTPCLSRPHRPTPFRGLPGGVFTTTVRSSVSNRRAAPEVPSRIFAQSLRLTPTACHVAKSPSCAHRACQIPHLTYYH